MSPVTPSVELGDNRRVVFIEELAILIGKSPTSIRTYATHKKYKTRNLIPPPFKMPNSRRHCWYANEVQAWIDSTRPAYPPPARRPRGRPTKIEQLSRLRFASGQGPS